MSEDQQFKAELDQLVSLRDLLNERIQTLQLRRILPSSRNGSNIEVIYATDIRPYVQEWIDNHNTLEALADKSDCSVQTLQRILSGKHETLRVRTADKILTALGLPHIFNELVPDPPESKYYEE